MDAAERELTHFFESLTQNQDKRTICRILLNQKLSKYLKSAAKILALVFVLYLTWQAFSNGISWFVSALLRLALINILPYWDWTLLYNNQCLIKRTTVEADSVKTLPFAAENCLLCASLEYVPNISNVTFAYLETHYLESGVPVVITDSHAAQTLADFINNLLEHAAMYLEIEPCEVLTNLLLQERFNMEMAFIKLDLANTAFLQLRNCQFEAVKLSRIFIKKPYFYPVHLEPFYSSWLIFSRNMALQDTALNLQGLILVQQWQGFINIILKPQAACQKSCHEINMRLFAGESLLFTTDLWNLTYNLFSKDDETVTTILEIDWKL